MEEMFYENSTEVVESPRKKSRKLFLIFKSLVRIIIKTFWVILAEAHIGNIMYVIQVLWVIRDNLVGNIIFH